MRLRPFLFGTHQVLGLIAALFVLALGTTGAIMAFEPEIQHLRNPRLWYVTPPAGATRVSIAQLGKVVHDAYPADTIQGYLIATRANLSDQVATTSGLVFVNEYSAQLLGQLRFGWDWQNAVHQFHTHLLIPGRARVGSKIVTGAAVLLLLILISGLYLWWPVKRVTVSWRGGGSRRTWFDLHNVSGIFAWLFLVLLTLTGLVIGMEDVTTPLLYRLTGSTPSHRPALHVAPPRAGAPEISFDSAFAIARAALPGAAPFEMDVPDPGQAIMVRMRYPEDRTPGGRSMTVINPYTGAVLFAEGSRTAPAGARMVIQNRAIHTGDLLGIPSKILMSLASLMAVVQVVTGVVMWFKRKERTT